MTESNACEMCGKSDGRYTCPKCNVLYCSVACYQSQKHIECSETFYEKLVTEELRSCSSDPEKKQRMLEILKQNQQNASEESLDSDDDESIPDLDARLSNVNLDDEEAVWENLMPNEKQEFNKLIATGDIIKLLPEVEPWWILRKRKLLIQDCDESFDWKSLCPAVPSEIPPLSTITKVNPSPSIKFMLINILESYVFTIRWFKSAFKDMPVEAISTIIALSATLRDDKIFNSFAETLVTFEDDVSKCKWIDNNTYDRGLVMEDLYDIIKGSDCSNLFYCLKASICDLKSLCSEAVCILKTSKLYHIKRFSGSAPKISQLLQISKKMTYYLSWITDHGFSLVSSFHIHDLSQFHNF